MRKARLAFVLLVCVGLIALVRLLHQPSSIDRKATSRARSESMAASPRGRPAESIPKTVPESNFLTRPPAVVASRNERRSGLAWVLRQLGASEKLLDRLADQDLVSPLTELRERAAGGDASAINILAWISYQKCYLARSEEQISGHVKDQSSQATALPPDDAAWVSAMVQSRGDTDRRFAAACSQVIDSNQVTSWLNDEAARGNAASLWLLSRQANTLVEEDQLLREAAAAGFAQAQFELAWDILGKRKRAAGTDSADLSAVSLLREAAASLPLAEANLAVCQYWGCEGVAPDVSAAVAHARDAANKGTVEALLQLGPHLSTGQVSADEITAWKLIEASLQQSGCATSPLNVEWMKSNSAVLSGAEVSPGALKLATQIWEDHGRQMQSDLGCTS